MFASILLMIDEVLYPSDGKKVITLKCYLAIYKVIVDRNWGELKSNVQEHLESASRVITSVSEPISDEYLISVKRLRSEYFLSRIQSSVREEDFEATRRLSAEAKIEENYAIFDATTVLELCRILYNTAAILKDSPDIGAKSNAKCFLRDVQVHLELPIAGVYSHEEFKDLKYASLLLLTSYLIDEDLQIWDPSECRKYLELLQNLYPQKVDPYVLNVIFCKKSDGEHAAYAIENVLTKMITSVRIPTSFDSVANSVKDFAATDPKGAAKIIDHIILNNLNPESDQRCLEKATVLRIFLITQAKSMTTLEIIDSLEDFLKLCEGHLKKDISKYARSTIIALLWNSGKKLEKGGKYSESIRFFKLTLTNVIGQNYEDRAKLQRALQNAYTMSGDYIEAEMVYRSMHSRDKKHPLTQFLRMKARICAQDEDEALECLNVIRNSKHINAVDVLALAISECKGSKRLALRAVLLILRVLKERQTTAAGLADTHFSTLILLRYILQMVMQMAENDQEEDFEQYLSIMNELLNVGIVFLTIKKAPMSRNCQLNEASSFNKEVSEYELEWFASTSYNIALKCSGKGIISQQPDFASCSLKYLEMIPFRKFASPKAAHYVIWKFRVGTLCVLSLRNTTEPGDDVALRNLEIRASSLLDEVMLTKRDELFLKHCYPEQVKVLSACYLDVLILNFEVVLDLRDHKKIAEIIKLTADFQDSQIDASLVDTAISNTCLPRDMRSGIIEAILARNIGNENAEDLLLCFWLRKLLDISAESAVNSRKNFIDRILARLQSTYTNNQAHESHFKQEMQMLATLTWNEGVRLIIKECKTVGAAYCESSTIFAGYANEALKYHLKSLWESLASSAGIHNVIHDKGQDA